MRFIGPIWKTLAVAGAYLVLTPLLHKGLAPLIPRATLTGAPHMPVLLAVILVQAAGLVGAFHLLRGALPARRGWAKGLWFMAFFLLAVQIPTVFGVIAFDPFAWVLFNPAKINDYWTLAIDVVAFGAAGALMGALFPSPTARPLPPAPRLAMAAGALVFPLALWAFEHAITARLPLPPLVPAGVDPRWFDIALFGPFSLTGLALPWLLAATRRGPLYATGVFALCWLPVQNFMVAFGWDWRGGLAFSLVSLLPIYLVLLLARALGIRPASG
ncbi:MAG: hypothetical protein ABIO70_28070 [Pseudomonadota bacterium]